MSTRANANNRNAAWGFDDRPMIHLDIPYIDGEYKPEFGSIIDHRVPECPLNKAPNGCPELQTCPLRHLNRDGTTICGQWVCGTCPRPGYRCMFSHRLDRMTYCRCCDSPLYHREHIHSYWFSTTVE